MPLPLFKLEDYFEPREHSARFLFSSSDLQTYRMQELLAMADPECNALWENLSLGYTESRGFLPLREEVSRCYKNLDVNQVLLCTGAEEAIFATFSSLLTSDDHVITVVPCYESLYTIPESLCSVTTLSLSEENNWELDLSKLKSVIRPNTKLIIVNFPHNPTGALISPETFDELVSIARTCGTYLFFDEVYRLLELNSDDRLPAIADVYEKGISLGVMSKAYGLAGLRLGWIASQDRTLIQKVLQFKYYLSICNSAPSEILSLIALRNKDVILQRNHALMTNNLTLLDSFFKTNESLFQWCRPKGGCTGFVKLLSSMPIETFADRLLLEKGVMILPGSVYSWPGNYFRVSYGRADMPETLKQVEQFIATHPLPR